MKVVGHRGLAGTGLHNQVARAHGLVGQQLHDASPERVGEHLRWRVERGDGQHARRTSPIGLGAPDALGQNAMGEGTVVSKMYPKPRTVRM